MFVTRGTIAIVNSIDGQADSMSVGSDFRADFYMAVSVYDGTNTATVKVLSNVFVSRSSSERYFDKFGA